MIGLDTESSLSYQAFSLFGTLLVAAVPWAVIYHGRFELERSLPRLCTVGVPFKYAIRIKNLRATNQNGVSILESTEEVEDVFSPNGGSAARSSAGSQSFRLVATPKKIASSYCRALSVPALPGHHSVEVFAELLPLQRGIIHFKDSQISRTDPFGLLRGIIRVTKADRLLVLPKRYIVPELPLPGGEQYQLGGVAQASSVGQSDEFISLRDYRRGDPVRHIHWRSWAKTGEPIVKEFEDEFFVRHGLVLDTFAETATSAQFEEAVSVAASFACSVRTQESLLDLMFVGTEAYRFSVGRGLAHTDQLLEILACARPASENTFESLRELVLQYAGVLTSCLWVMLDWDEQRQALVQEVMRLGVPVHVWVVLPATGPETLPLGPMASNPQAFKVLHVSKVAEELSRP